MGKVQAIKIFLLLLISRECHGLCVLTNWFTPHKNAPSSGPSTNPSHEDDLTQILHCISVNTPLLQNKQKILTVS